jgi:16S rRNA (cytosine1407-C5)-methyltransferase
LRATVDDAADELTRLGFPIHPVDCLREAFILRADAAERRRLTESSPVREGRIYVQDLASMMAAPVLGPQPGETILDLAAAPGGKTLHMAALMQNQGTISAVESVRTRFFKLKTNLRTGGATMVRAYLMDGRTVGRKTPERFDRVLLDAPCSGEARFDQREPKTWRYWSLKKIRESARKQGGLIRSGLRALKPGGTLLYCTCSFAPEENERVIHQLLVEKGDAVQILPLQLPLAGTQPGLTEWQNQSWHPRLSNAVRILPTAEMDGLFLALIRKPSVLAT